MILHAIFDPQGRSQEALTMKAISLLVDGRQLDLERSLVAEPEVVNGWINATFDLPRTYWESIKEGDALGVMFQHWREAPVFLGFQGLPLKEARKFLYALESSCPLVGDRATTNQAIEPNRFDVFKNRDFFGADLTQNGFKGISLGECESICLASQACLAYSYVERLNWCFPKSGLGRPAAKPGVVSGVRR